MRKSVWAVAGACLALSLGVVGCGSDSGGSSAAAGPTTSAGDGCPAGVKERLQAKLAKYEAVPTFKAPGPSFDASKAAGKKIFNIPMVSTDTFNQLVDKAEAEAAKAAGVQFVSYNNQGDPSQWVAGMNQAISQNADLIILEGGPDPKALGPQLAAAKKAGIKVISTHRFDSTEVEKSLKEYPNLTAIVPANAYLGSGQLSADYAMVESDCNVNAVLLEASDVQPTAAGIVATFKEELAANCPDTCKATSTVLPFNQWAQKASGELQSKLTQDPTINFIAPNFDQGALYARQAILSSGRSDTVKIVAYNGSAPVMQLLADKQSVISEVGEPLGWLGWHNVDQALRVLADEKPTTTPTPIRMFDKTNIADAGTPVSQTKGYGDASVYRDGFSKLWGLK